MKNKLFTFLEPALADKKVFFLTNFIWFILRIFVFVNILLIQKIIKIIESWTKDWIINITIIFIIINIIFFAFTYISKNYRWINIDMSVVNFLQEKYMKKFNNLSNIQVEVYWTWKLISIIKTWINAWSDLIYEWIRVCVWLFVSFLATLIIILQFWKDYYILIIILILVISTYVLTIVTKKSWEARKYVVKQKIIYDRQLVKILMNKFEILQNSKINEEIQTLNNYYNNSANWRKIVWKYNIWNAIIPDLVLSLIYVAFLLLLIYTNIPFSIIISFLLVLGFLKSTIDWLALFCSNFSRVFSDVEKLWDFFETIPEIKGLNTWKDFIYKNGNIELKNISFSYWDNLVFDNFSLKIKWNYITAFVGESWGWKTTLMKLISGFIETQSWKIIIDWQNLNEINLMNYYKEIWYLTQEPNVFDWSILENLTYWSKQEITEKKLKEVIKKAKCEFIYDFKNWLKTEIWERWVRLSWWQKQRLAIAKIFLKNPKIIFLDEPTSALDSKSEKLIHESFTELFKWRTVIIIAHRLQTVKSADEIFVIEEGKIVEIWNHESLSRKKGHYREMLDLQSGF